MLDEPYVEKRTKRRSCDMFSDLDEWLDLSDGRLQGFGVLDGRILEVER